MAGDEEWHRVIRHDRTHGAGRLRRTDLAGHPGVGPDLAARNPLYYLQYLSLEGCHPREVRRDLDLLTGERRDNTLGEPVRPLVRAPRKEAAEALSVAPGQPLRRGSLPEEPGHTLLAPLFTQPSRLFVIHLSTSFSIRFV